MAKSDVLRITIFFMTAQFLSSFANILAYGLIQIASHPTIDGWKWIYIVEGSITIGIGILARFIIIDFPESKRNRFLTSDEVTVVRGRLEDERGRFEAEKVTWRVILVTLQDWWIWSW